MRSTFCAFLRLSSSFLAASSLLSRTSQLAQQSAQGGQRHALLLLAVGEVSLALGLRRSCDQKRERHQRRSRVRAGERERNAHDESVRLLRSASTTWCLLRLGRARRSAGRRGKRQLGRRARGLEREGRTDAVESLLPLLLGQLPAGVRIARQHERREEGSEGAGEGRTAGRRTPWQAPEPARPLSVRLSPPRSRPRGSRISAGRG